MIVYARKMIIICMLATVATFNVHASVLEATDNAPKLDSGRNLLAIGVYEDSPGSSDATLIVKLVADNKSPEDQLASEIEGAVIYARYNRIYKVVIGDWKPIELSRGQYARWGPSGKKIAVYDRRKIYIMNADGSGRKLVTNEAWEKRGCPIEFHTNGREIIFIRRNKRGLWAVNISNGKMRKLADFHDYSGEPGISADGKRIACRGNGLYAIDLEKRSDFVYSQTGCSSGISPDGRWLMNNEDGHKTMTIRSWDGKTVKTLRASICQPDGEWDNQTWSNNNDYILAQGGNKGESYVIKVSAERGTRVTWIGNTVYPDLYVKREIQHAKLKIQDRQEIPTLSLESWIMGLLPAVIASDKSLAPPVILVNENYNRLTSRVMIRRITRPTLANLDYAAYDSNVMRHDPVMYKPNPPAAQDLSDLHFDNTLVPGSLTDRLSGTPLTPAEKVAPMSWSPMVEYLMDWDFDPGYALAEAGWKISEDMWNDDKLPISYQEISRVYLHKNDDGTHSLWVKIEFKPWVKFLKNVDDEDKDGYPEIYGMMDGRFLDDRVIKKLTDDYMQQIFSPDEISEWAADLAADWYDKYNTRALEPDQIKIWPNAQTEPEVKAELGKLVLEQPDAVIRGKPFGKYIYSVFLVR